jgi:RimJ/RimL family protein N-acetyltransferase
VWTLLLLKSLYDRRSPVDPDAITWKLVFSTDINIVPKNMHELRTKFAVKYVENYSEGFSETTNNYLALAQYIYRFSRRWDADAWGRFMGQNGSGTNQLGAGIELGYLFFDRIRVGAGYSVNGFEEKDMAERDAWEKGFGVRVQLLLTDWIFNEVGIQK